MAPQIIHVLRSPFNALKALAYLVSACDSGLLFSARSSEFWPQALASTDKILLYPSLNITLPPRSWRRIFMKSHAVQGLLTFSWCIDFVVEILFPVLKQERYCGFARRSG